METLKLILLTLMFFLLGTMLLNMFWVLIQNILARKMSRTGVVLRVKLETASEVTPIEIEQLWTTLHGTYKPWYFRLLKAQPYFAFEINAENLLNSGKSIKRIAFNFWVPEEYRMLIEDRISSTYPEAQIEEIDLTTNDYIPSEDADLRFSTAEVGLRENSAFSLRRFKDFESDPLGAITASLSSLEEEEVAVVQVMVRPLSKAWNKKAERTLLKWEKTNTKPGKLPEITNLFGQFFLLIFKITDGILNGIFALDHKIETRTVKSSRDSELQKNILEKVNKPAFAFQIRILVGSPLGKEYAKKRIDNIIASLREYSSENELKKETLVNPSLTIKRMRNRSFNVINNDDVLATDELAGICHLPNKNIRTPDMERIQSKRNEIPLNVSRENPFAMGIDSKGNKRLIGLDLQARLRHVYISGMVRFVPSLAFCRNTIAEI